MSTSETGFDLISEYVFNINSRVYWSKSGIASHMRSHDNKQLQADIIQVFPQQPTSNAYQFFDKVADLRKHLRVLRVNVKDNLFACHVLQGLQK